MGPNFDTSKKGAKLAHFLQLIFWQLIYETFRGTEMKKARMTFVLICLGICFLLTSTAWAACERIGTTCYPGSQANPTSLLIDVQDCVSNYAQSGDTVSIPAGTPTWAGPLTIYNKNITVKGPDCAVDSNGRPTSCPLTINLTGNAFCSGHYAGPTAGICVATNSSSAVTDGQSSTGLAVKKVSWRIHDMAFVSNNIPSNTQDLLEIETSEYNYNPSIPGNDYPIMGWRLDHIKIERSTYLNSLRFIIVGGVTWGLMDHLNFTSAGNLILSQVAGLTHEFYDGASAGAVPNGSWSGNFAWSLPLHLGSDEALYVEDSTFTFNGTGAYGWNDMISGADIVIRNNKFYNNTIAYSHTGEGGTLGRGGGRKYEVYNNLSDGAGMPGHLSGSRRMEPGCILTTVVRIIR